MERKGYRPESTPTPKEQVISGLEKTDIATPEKQADIPPTVTSKREKNPISGLEHTEQGEITPVIEVQTNALELIKPGMALDVEDFYINSERQVTEGKKDKYLIEKVLGAGGMGTAFIARKELGMDDDYGQQVVIKVMSEEGFHSDDARERFKREMVTHVASAEVNPYVVPVHNFVDIAIPGSKEKKMGIVMQYMEDGDLRGLSRKLRRHPELEKQMGERLIGTVAKEVSSVLAGMHNMGVAHRDIKLDNIFVNYDSFHIVVGDFGIAKAISDTREWVDEHEQVNEHRYKEKMEKDVTRGDVIGTPEYQSPEYIVGEEGSEIGTDLYALGVTLFQLRSHGTPFESNNVVDLHMKKIEENPRTLREVIGETYEPQLFDPIIEAMIQHDQEKRKEVTIDGEVYDISTALNLKKTIESLYLKYDVALPPDAFVPLKNTKEEITSDVPETSVSEEALAAIPPTQRARPVPVSTAAAKRKVVPLHNTPQKKPSGWDKFVSWFKRNNAA